MHDVRDGLTEFAESHLSEQSAPISCALEFGGAATEVGIQHRKGIHAMLQQ